MRYFNIDFEKAVNFEKLVKLFNDKFGDTKSAFLINNNFSSNLTNDTQKADIFWYIDNLEGFIDIDGTFVSEYTDIKIRSYITFSEYAELPIDEFLLWLHKVSISLESKVYVDIEIPSNPFGYSTSWCIDGMTRSIVFEAEEILNYPDSTVPDFYYIEPVIDLTRYL